MDTVPVGVVTYNRPAYLARTLQSLLASDLPGHVPIVVFDDCSTDPIQRRFLTTADQIRLPVACRFPNTALAWRKWVGHVPDARSLRGIAGKVAVRISRTNRGSTGNETWAVRSLFHEHPGAPGVIVVEDDVILRRDWYPRMLKAFAGNPTYGILSGTEIGSRGSLQESGVETVEVTGSQLYLYSRAFYESCNGLVSNQRARRHVDTIMCRIARRHGFEVGVLRPAVCQHIGVDSKDWPGVSFLEANRFDRSFVPETPVPPEPKRPPPAKPRPATTRRKRPKAEPGAIQAPDTPKFVLPREILKPGDPFRKLYPAATKNNYHHYYDIVLEFDVQSIFEIGVRAGYSMFAMLSANPRAFYRGLDADLNTDGGAKGYYRHAIGLIEQYFPEADAKVIVGDSQLLWGLPRRFDLIHVDGCHSYGGALRDMEVCAPSANLLLVDDYAFLPPVRKALDRFLAKYDARYDLRPRFIESWHGLVLMNTSGFMAEFR